MHMLKNLELKKDQERIKELETIVFTEESNNEKIDQWMNLDSPNLLIENLAALITTLRMIKNSKENTLSKKKSDE